MRASLTLGAFGWCEVLLVYGACWAALWTLGWLLWREMSPRYRRGYPVVGAILGASCSIVGRLRWGRRRRPGFHEASLIAAGGTILERARVNRVEVKVFDGFGPDGPRFYTTSVEDQDDADNTEARRVKIADAIARFNRIRGGEPRA